MGEVYRATDSKLGREVAIKLIPEDFARDARAWRGSRARRRCSPPSTIRTSPPSTASRTARSSWSWSRATTLSERIKQGPLPLDEALDIARQIADGLEAAHDKGIVHRDLKPANIKITPGGTVKLLDFGLAKADGPWTSSASIDGRADAHRRDDRRGHDSRHRGVHGARAGARPERGQARRHLGLRRDPLRDAHRRADVRRRNGHRRARLGGASGSRSQARAGEGAAAAPALSRKGSEATAARRRRRDAAARHRAGCDRGGEDEQDAAARDRLGARRCLRSRSPACHTSTSARHLRPPTSCDSRSAFPRA